MGYFSTGFVFGREPAWPHIQRSLPESYLRGYKHKERDLWLLDAWQRRIAGGPHDPFSEGPPTPSDFAVKAQPVPQAVALFDRIDETLGEWWGGRFYGAEWLLVPWSVASAAGVPTFAFIADDESWDFAALVADGAFVRVGCRVGLLAVVLDGESFRIIPYEDESDEPVAPELLDKLASLPGVRVVQPEEFDNAFYSQPTRLWPAEWGDCAELLGLGTWDPFVDFERTFALVYQADPKTLPAAPAQRAKPTTVAAAPAKRAPPTPEPWGDVGFAEAIASCLLWPFGVFLACAHLLKSRRRKALAVGLLAAVGLMLAIGLEALERALTPALGDEARTVAGATYAVLAVGAALGIRAWLKRSPRDPR